jgi:hypothetical protein
MAWRLSVTPAMRFLGLNPIVESVSQRDLVALP